MGVIALKELGIFALYIKDVNHLEFYKTQEEAIKKGFEKMFQFNK